MANVKITDLTAAASLTADDLLAIVDDPAGTPATKRATLQQILDLITAADVDNTPSGNLAATTVQAALNELQTDIDGRLESTAGWGDLADVDMATVAPSAGDFATFDGTDWVPTDDIDGGSV